MATDSNNLSLTDSSDSNDSSNSYDNCNCQKTYDEFLKELDSIKEFLEDLVTDHATIHRLALSELKDVHEEFVRKIDNLIDEICEDCNRHHDTVDCKTESGEYVQSNAGCSSKNHKVLL